MDGKRRQLHDGVAARRIAVVSEKALIILHHMRRNLQLHLRRTATVGGRHVHVYRRSNMQHHIVVSRILVVSVQKPVGRALVYLHIAHPQRAVKPNLGIEEVGTRVMVMQTGIDYLHESSVRSAELVERQYAVFPDIMQELFHKGVAIMRCEI